MKVLRIDLRYQLPDDWTGSPADALREAARFLDCPNSGLDELPVTVGAGAAHATFYLGTLEGVRMNGEISVYEATPPRWKWTRCQLTGALPRVHVDGERFIK